MFTCPRQTLGKVLTNSQPACLCSLSPGSGWVINDHHVGDVDGNDAVVEGEDMEFVLSMVIPVSLLM